MVADRLAQAKAIVRRCLAGRVVPLFHQVELSAADRAQRAHPFPYLVAGCHLAGLVGARTIVEIGAMRGPLNHPIAAFDPACCMDGHSTAVWAETGLDVHSVDIDPTCILFAELTRRAHPNLHCYTEDGIGFLERFSGDIGLLYLDAWDVDPGAPYAEGHLAAYQAAHTKLAPSCIVQIDDTDIYFGGKGELLVPRLIRDGFELLTGGRQTILIRLA